MTAPGRKRTVILAIFEPTERPLSGKADIQLIGLMTQGVKRTVSLIEKMNNSDRCIHCHHKFSYIKKLWNLEKNVIECPQCKEKSALVYPSQKFKFIYKLVILITCVLTLASIPWFPYFFPVGLISIHFLSMYPYKNMSFEKITNNP